MHNKAIRVLLVDDEILIAERLAARLVGHGFEVVLANSVRDALGRLQSTEFDTVVTDVLFDGRPEGNSIVEAVGEYQANCPVFVMTGFPGVSGAVTAMKCGAADYLPKPIDPVNMVAMIHRAVRERHVRCEQLEFSELVDIVSGLVANTIERIDPYTAGHGQRTRHYCDVMAEKANLDRGVRERLQLAAIAHDYGKIYLEDLGFLTKEGPLTDREYQSVKLHPALGAEKLGNTPRLKDVCRWIEEHHERWDGRGYPYKKKGEEISLPGRILGIVEVFDSLATRRSYKQPWPLEKVMDFFEDHREKNFDPDLTDLFLAELETHGEAWIAQPQRDRAALGVDAETPFKAHVPGGPTPLTARRAVSNGS